MGFIDDHLSRIQWDSLGIHVEFTKICLGILWNSRGIQWDSFGIHWDSTEFIWDSMGFMVDRKQSIISPLV